MIIWSEHLPEMSRIPSNARSTMKAASTPTVPGESRCSVSKTVNASEATSPQNSNEVPTDTMTTEQGRRSPSSSAIPIPPVVDIGGG